MKKIVLLIFIILIIVVIVGGCNPTANPAKVGNTEIVVPINYDNGLYYFPVIEAQFANSLSHFLKNHPDLSVAAIAGDGNSTYGRDAGYYVVFSKVCR